MAGLLDQFTNGANGAAREAVAGTLGAPVDFTTAGLNGVMAGMGRVLPQGFPAITNPVGGSAYFAQLMRNMGALHDQPGTGSDAVGGLLGGLVAGLKPNALNDVRGVLQRVIAGEKPPYADIAKLTPKQFTDLNNARVAQGMPPFESPNVVYRGTHHYDSRVTNQVPPNSPDELLRQIQSGLSDDSRVVRGGRTPALQNPTKRIDERGNPVDDEAVLTRTSKGNPELYSVIPRGDGSQKKRP